MSEHVLPKVIIIDSLADLSLSAISASLAFLPSQLLSAPMER
jgi:hypothetical protein